MDARLKHFGGGLGLGMALVGSWLGALYLVPHLNPDAFLYLAFGFPPLLVLGALVQLVRRRAFGTGLAVSALGALAFSGGLLWIVLRALRMD